jgi:2-oxoglutarate dehydrogenase E1 component
MTTSTPAPRVFETNPAEVEAMFELYQKSPNGVPADWQRWFEAFRSGFSAAKAFLPTQASPENSIEGAAERLTSAYKRYGHLKAQTNPLNLNRPSAPILEPSAHGLGTSDFSTWLSPNTQFSLPAQTLGERIQTLESLFCQTAAPEFEHVENPQEKAWLYEKLKSFHTPLSPQNANAIFEELAFADAFEKTLGTKYIGKKRFSIEGADAQIPALESILDSAASLGTQKCVMGMAHRGRLAIIVGVVKMPFEMMLAEFEGEIPEGACCDDVKYHCGFESTRPTRSGHTIHIKMSSNPSHLEAINPVLMGEARAEQALHHNGDTQSVLPILLHGDAAISGQGVVYETLQMANLGGYSVGGIIHIIANNQLGFTTDPEYSRSSTSCTDIARVIGAPIVHVNSEDLTALHNIATLAVEYRQKFKKDFFIDLICYRRHGHNEADEPTYTQPGLYKLIKEKQSPWVLWREVLLAQNSTLLQFNAESLNAGYTKIRTELDSIYVKMKNEGSSLNESVWSTSCGHPSKTEAVLAQVHTAVSPKSWNEAASGLISFPASAKPHSKLSRMLLASRAEMAAGRARIDWGMGEMMAYATLVAEGFSFRLSGQDVGRGTFSHRHAVFVDELTGEHHIPLKNMIPQSAKTAANAPKVEVVNSPLSEFAVLGFEYGYARTHSKALVVWEAQFGDFANGAQIIIDQFLAAGECKWHSVNNMVLLLPHGFEGQGAEHSSARIERFLQLAADGNMIIANVTSSAQLFHILRRQMHGDAHKPLVIFTPKSYLRSPLSACSVESFTEGGFSEVLDDSLASPQKVKRVVFASGKVALDLISHESEASGAGHYSETAIVRIEQLYPMNTNAITALLQKYTNATHYFWVQEEPKNMGPWLCIAPELRTVLSRSGIHAELQYLGRHAKSSPAGGLEKIHKADQAKLIAAAFEATQSTEV